MATFCLSVHAAYACRHTGVCCTAPWRIPIEPAKVQQLRLRKETATFLDRGYEESYVARHDDGACVFFEPERGRLCTIHRVAGADLLPSACRNFPRVALHDPRGTFVTLSSFCPTAAAMLNTRIPLRIVEAPPPLTLDGTLEGLDATRVMPPLLCSGVLTDYEGYTAWEHAAIAVLDRDDLQAGECIEIIAAATEAVQYWRPGRRTLAEHVARAFAQVTDAAADARALESRPLRMFVAAHLFASWAAYQNRGLEGVIAAVRNALDRVERELASGVGFEEAARAADWVLRHVEEDVGT